MDAVEYRMIKLKELSRELFRSFQRRQVVNLCWRREAGRWVIREAPFLDQWSESDYHFLTDCLRNTIRQGGVVYGAFLAGAIERLCIG